MATRDVDEINPTTSLWRARLPAIGQRLKRWIVGDAQPGRTGQTPGYPWESSYPESIDWRASLPVKPLFALLDDAAEAHPNSPCIYFMGRTYKYREVAKLVSKAAKGLQDLGVTKGTRVGLLLPNSPFFVIFYYAVLKIGGTVVNYNPLYAEAELIRQSNDSDTRIMITVDLEAIYPKLARILEQTPISKVVVCPIADGLPLRYKALFSVLRRNEIAAIPDDENHIRFSRLIDNEGTFKPVEVDPAEDIAVLQYTGGTTGEPKGAMLSHASLYANACQARIWFPDLVAGQERIMGVLPLFHVFAMTVVMNAGLHCAAELILLPRFKMDTMLKAIVKRRPTVFPGVPTMFAMISDYDGAAKRDLSSLKYCLSGGAPLSPEIKHRFETLTDCTLVEGYGLSESAPVVTCNPFVGANKVGSAGLPLPGTVVEITSLKQPGRLLPLGERGEICVRGPQVMKGYWRRSSDNADTLADGRLHTGDVGYLDEDGYLFIVDRIKELVLVGGYNVYPRMVEEAIGGHPAILEVAVCGIPDPRFGEKLIAFICLREGETLSGGSVRAFLKDKLASFEIPRSYEFKDSLPKTIIGKIDKKALLAEPAPADPGNGALNSPAV